ncbi:hypothetical protein [Desulfobulbus alkaliphilus]|uniref:hypothetical protein n=1 Tax=Desulfobulbus alkaliphilus TaxID=869814 RepID=UPI001964D3CD|nr:hypothetical protein [Desulfobulbus alkaliphilus]MBM9536177.1 hypothetical protein [Desulfobulbus alkaliphilus]
MKDIFEEMAARWPSAIVERSKLSEFTGGAIAPGTIANADSQGRGPAVRLKIGNRRVAYPVSAVVEWLKARATVIDTKYER